MTRAIALVDLDDTLFQTLGKCPNGIAPERLTALGFTRDNVPLSYATPSQMRFLSWLSDTTRLIPVTARSLDALRRVSIPFTSAVCAHGGVILDDEGSIDPVWAEEIAAHAARHSEDLSRFSAAIADKARSMGTSINVRVLTENGTPLYVVAKHAAADAASLNWTVDAAVPRLPEGWTDHRNGNNIALMPPYLGKQHAVARLLPALRARFPDAPVIGIGDSRTDAPFMALCDYAMMPTRSQLAGLILDGR